MKLRTGMQLEFLMDSVDFLNLSSLNNEQLQQIGKLWSIEQWKQNVTKLDPHQIASILPMFTPSQDPLYWKEKIHAIIDALIDPSQLEAVGRSLSYEQINEILSWIAENHYVNQAKLFSLFIGLPKELFLQLLLHASPEQRLLLKQESLSEPIQHHLTLLSQVLSLIADNQNKIFSKLELQISTLDLSTIDAADIVEQEVMIESLRQTCFSTQLLASKSLGIAWNTNRTDIIEKLSSIKEQSQKLSQHAIGIPRTFESVPSGLYRLLESHLDSVFANENKELLSNDEPAIEALVKFSIWYVHDYWEIGLLPDIIDAAQLDLDPSSYSEKERLHYRETLFAIVESNLKKLGLYTLGDLKQHRIYSKTALRNFILNPTCAPKSRMNIAELGK